MLRTTTMIVAALVFLGVAWWLFRNELAPGAPSPAPEPRAEAPPVVRSDPAEPASTMSAASPPPAVTPPEPKPPERAERVPALAESDPFVRDRLAPLGLPEEWVAKDQLVRRLGVLIDNATRSELPHKQLQFLRPDGAYRVVEREGRFTPDPANAARFDPLLDLLESISPTTAASLIVKIEPLLAAALRELGTQDSPREVVLEAIDRALEAPEPPRDPVLVRPKVLYQYADPALEALPPLDKQLMRLGPRNHARMRTYLTGLRRAMLDVESVNPPS